MSDPASFRAAPEERRRVLLLSQAPGVGGGELVTIPALSHSRKLEVVVAAQPDVCRLAQESGLQAIPMTLGWVRSWMSMVPMVLGSMRVASVARRHRADLLYANGSRAMPYGVGARILTGLPLIVHHHGLLTSGPWRSLVAAIDRWAEAIIVPSQASAEPFRNRSKVHLVRNGVDLKRFHPPRDRGAAKLKLGFPENCLVVGTVSRADPRKGMAAFIRVAKRLADLVGDVRFLIAGGAAFPHELRHYEEIKRAASESLGDRVVMTGHLQDPVPAYQALDIFVHLSDPEGLPLTVLEAMACGLPVVAYHWGGVAEIIGEDQAGFPVNPGDEEGVASTIVKLATDTELRRASGLSCRAHCEKNHDFSKYVEELEAVVWSLGAR